MEITNRRSNNYKNVSRETWELTLSELSTRTRPYSKAQRRQVDYIDFLSMGFDIETTTQYRKENGQVTWHFTNMYIWQWQIEEYTFIGRTMSELSEFIRLIEKYIVNKGGHFTICFIHNLSFEFNNLARELQLKYGHNISIFARKKRKPMKWVLDNKIIFLDSYLLTHLSLELLAKNYCTTRKLVGELDYSKVRNSLTPLDEKTELPYCYNDVRILKEYADYYEAHYMEYRLLIMTQTMIANLCVKDMIKQTGENPYNLMRKCYPKSRKQYEYLMLFFSGAYTHGFAPNLFKTIKNCMSWDVTSEYPFVMMSKYYPMSKFRKLQDISRIEEFLPRFCCLVDVTFENIKSKYGVTILSKNKVVEADGVKWDNGRLLEAKSVRAFVTEVDLQTLSWHYDFTPIYHSCIYAKRGKLPKYLRLTIAHLYCGKDELKAQVKQAEKDELDEAIIQNLESELMATKGSLNGQYGSLAVKLTFDEITYDGGWGSTEKPIDFDTIWQGKNKLPQWAIYVTSWARNLVLNPVRQICEVNPKDYIYTDTDSLKVKEKEYIYDIFKCINDEIRTENEDFISELNLRELYPNTDYSSMGTFDFEGTMQKLKTLGSKRYIYTDEKGNPHQTIAGLPKGTFFEYCDKHGYDYFEYFTENGIDIADCESNKLVTYYCDSESECDVMDDYGNTVHYHNYAHVSLIPTTFNLKVCDDLVLLAQKLQYLEG